MALNQVDISMMQDIPAPGPAGKIIISDGADWTSGENAPVGSIVKQATDPTPTDPATPSVGDMILNNITGQLFSCTTETPSAAVWTVIGVVDLSPVKNDISLLALQNAINGNLSAYGLKNSWIEQFEDSTKIDNLTTCDRNNSEYVSSVVLGTPTYLAGGDIEETITFFGSNPSGGINTGQAYNVSSHGTSEEVHQLMVLPSNLASQSWYWSSPTTGGSTGFYVDYLQSYTWTKFKISKNCCAGEWLTVRLSYGDDGTNWTTVDLTGATSTTWSEVSSGYQNTWSGSTFDANGILTSPATATNNTQGSIITLGTAINARYLRVEGMTWNATGNSNVGWGQLIPEYQQETISATGSFTSTAVVPQDTTNKSSVGLVVLYKDNGVSNCTLNTDIVAKVRANTGQAYQTLALAGAGTYSDGLKIAIAPAISVTAGQALSYEISFANQAASTASTNYSDSYSTGDRGSIITPTTSMNTTRAITKIVDGSKSGSSDGFYFTGSQTVNSSSYIRFQLSAARCFTGCRIWNDENNDSAGAGYWKWQASNDGTSWTDLGGSFQLINTGIPSTPGYDTFDGGLGNNLTEYTYYQMVGVSGTADFNSNWMEWEFEAGTGAVNGKEARIYGVAMTY